MLSILIVTFNNERHIRPCLDSLPWTRTELDVWVMDNLSADRTRDRIAAFKRSRGPRARLHFNPLPSNLGYTAAVNRGLAACRGEWICLLGPDAVVHPGALETMADYLKRHPRVGAVAPRLVNPFGQVQPSCRRFPSVRDAWIEMTGLPRLFPARLSPRWKMADFSHRAIREVEQPEATCLMIRRSVLDTVGPMDDRFPLFFNDVDWCRRIRRKGWAIVFLPGAVVSHVRGASVNRVPVLKIWKSHQGFYRYFSKHGPPGAALLLGVPLIGSAILRTILAVSLVSERNAP